MKFFKVLFLGFLFLGSVFANDLKEGEDYIVLSKPIKNMENSVIELFNIGCPHCAYYHKEVLPLLLELLPENVEFYPAHMKTNVRFHTQISEFLAVALIKDKKEGKDIKSKNTSYKMLLDNYFAIFHGKSSQKINNEEDLTKLSLEILKLEAKEYKTLLKSKEVKELLEFWDSLLEYASIQGVPSFIVKGKYMIKAQNIEGVEDLIYKIDVLKEQK
ncbi:disulfide bond formation protein DsbA [Helicobacter valdiviensis]|uniref:Disulfide bond formation protein DsbA n=1 Tax=Helicobacter valdiviensis TaxID=1458358 RepID=A0A2W6MRZ8_9HELI|nr:thioredoxin domain-containing protein [Helicobacter valdiviensis]PZT47344.1 disulfide bond formation protein DsbA [Helicobacter valdiviensis]